MESVFDDSQEAWLEFLTLPGGLFSEVPKLEALDDSVDPNEPTASFWDSASWEAVNYGGTFSSTDSTDGVEEGKPVFLAASEFVFQSGNRTETLVERIVPRRHTAGVVTTGKPQLQHESIQHPMPPRSLDYDAVMELLGGEASPKTEQQPDVEQEIKRGKRKLPEVDLDAISDPEERKRQKRMAKNRRTAAVSRLRKKARLDSLESQIESLQRENHKLKSLLSHFLSQGGFALAPRNDEPAMLLTVVLLVIMQSIEVLSQMSLMTLPKLSSLSVFLCCMTHLQPMRFAEHFVRYSAGHWQRKGVT